MMDDANKPVDSQTPNLNSNEPTVSGPETTPVGARPEPAIHQPEHQHTKKPRKRLLLIILLVLLLVIGGAAYWYANNSTKETDSNQQVTKNEIPLLRYGMFTAGGSLSAFYDNVVDGNQIEVAQQLYEGLVTYNDLTKIAPLLATGWTNPDDTTWVFDLKRGVKFHNGNEMKAADVKYSLENIKQTEKADLFGPTIDKVEVVSDYQVKVTTKGPDPLLLNRLVFIPIVDASVKKPTDPETATGPYRVKPGTTPTETSLEMVAFEGYHGDRQYTRAVTMKAYEDESDAVEAFKKGELDMVGALFEEESMTSANELGEILTVQSPSVSYLGVGHNVDGSPLKDKKVREAIYLAVDIDGIMKSRSAVGQPHEQIVTQEIPGYNPEIKRPARNVAQAKELLKEAGYEDGLTITFTYFAPTKALYEELAKQLKEVGITLKADEFSDPVAMGAKVFGDGKSQMWFASYFSDLADLSDVVAFMFQGANYNGNKTVDSLMVEANSTLDATKRLEHLQEASKVLMDDIAWIPLYTKNIWWATTSGIVVERDQPAGDSFGVSFARVYHE